MVYNMPSVVALSFIILGSIIFSVTLVIVCGKRKLSQRKECSRRDPHIPGQEAKKVLKREIERRLARVGDITYEPRLIPPEADAPTNKDCPPYYFRMKAVDNMKYLEEEIQSLEGVAARGLREGVRSFLMKLTSAPGGVLSHVEPRLIHELCDQYDHARHHPAPFQADHFTSFHALLTKILHCARTKGKCEVRSRTPCGRARAPSDHDSAIDEPDQSGDDDNLLVSEASLVLVQRPGSLHVKEAEEEDSYETSV